MNLLRPLLFLSALGLFATCAHAMELRFISSESTEDRLQFTDNGTTTPIQINGNSFSAACTFSGNGSLVLFKDIVSGATTVRKTVATLTAPAQFTTATVILTAIGRTGTYQGMWIDDSPTARPAGTVQVTNLSHHGLTLKLAAIEFALAPGATHQVTPATGASRVVMEVDASVGGAHQRVTSNPLPLRSGTRLLMILRDGLPTQGSTTNIVDILPFYDLPPPPAPPASPAAQTPSL